MNLKFSKKNMIICLILFLFFMKIVINSTSNSLISNDISSKTKDDELSKTSQSSSKTATNSAIEEKKVSEFVDIKGAIVNPGMYEITENTRLGDIVKKAGGFENANENCINLAQKLEDAQMVVIPSKNEKCEKQTIDNSQNNSENMQTADASQNNTQENGNTNKININTATVQELQTLEGVGETRAKDIIEYREKNGDFKDISEIQNVSGIGEKTYEKLKDKISI